MESYGITPSGAPKPQDTRSVEYLMVQKDLMSIAVSCEGLIPLHEKGSAGLLANSIHWDLQGELILGMCYH